MTILTNSRELRFCVLPYELGTAVILMSNGNLTDKWMKLQIDYKIFLTKWDNWEKGEFIQNTFSELSDSEREFLITGYTPDEWNALFGDEDETR